MTLRYDDIVNTLRNGAMDGVLPGHLKDALLTPATKLGELGIDSLGKMSLLAALMDLTDRYFPDDAFRDEHTLEEIAAIAGAAH
jgi:acyl carrier protein